MIALLAAMLSIVGIAQSAAGWIVIRQLAHRVLKARKTVLSAPMAEMPVTVLKPLHGDEPLLEEALASLCQQEYPIYQIVFGVSDTGDTALPVVRRLQLRFPDCDFAIVADATSHGPNGKVSNLINMLQAAKHDVLVIADSDVHTSPDWLHHLLAALEVGGVGLVTSVYTGLPVNDVVAALGAMQINHYFLPGALLSRSMGREDCLGATMALRRETLEQIGGFRALVDHLADDNLLGRLVRRLGLRVALANTLPATTVPETTFCALWRHELRWARTIRALVPAQFAASVLQYSLVWAVLAVLLSGGALWSLAWLALAFGLRALVAASIDRALGLANRTPLWLLPLREIMSVGVMAASYAGRRVDWRGHTMQAEGFNPR